MKVIVIGGGASGLVSSIIASKNNDVTILEKNSSLGKKILVTGNGKCNYFNSDFNTSHYTNKLDIINDENIDKIYNFFDEIGIVSRINNGYYYPMSNQAVSIVSSLVTEVNNHNIKVVLNTIVNDIKKENNKFIINTNNGIYTCDKVIYAVGSKAMYDTDIESNNYKILENLGHKITPLYPGLSKLKTNINFKELAGVRNDSLLSLYIDNVLIKEEVGELLFNENGLSGICVMQLSNYANKSVKDSNVVIKINFLNKLNINTYEECKEFLTKRNNKLPNRTLSLLFDTVLNYKLSNFIIKYSNLKLDNYLDKLDNKELDNLINNLINFEVKITGYSNFKESQIVVGGVPLNEINLNTMESRIIDGLYITGEILDVNGDCGGYNLGFAWLSGIIAGENI